MVKIAVLVSGGGTNLQALIDRQQAGELGCGQISLVISSRAGAYALQRAQARTLLRSTTALVRLLSARGIFS